MTSAPCACNLTNATTGADNTIVRFHFYSSHVLWQCTDIPFGTTAFWIDCMLCIGLVVCNIFCTISILYWRNLWKIRYFNVILYYSRLQQLCQDWLWHSWALTGMHMENSIFIPKSDKNPVSGAFYPSNDVRNLKSYIPPVYLMFFWFSSRLNFQHESPDPPSVWCVQRGICLRRCMSRYFLEWKRSPSVAW